MWFFTNDWGQDQAVILKPERTLPNGYLIKLGDC